MEQVLGCRVGLGSHQITRQAKIGYGARAALRDIQEIAKSCSRLLNGHRPRSVRERMQSIADSPLSMLRNDHYGRGGVLADFEREMADLLGKESALFMPSGTMAQQIALRIWSDLAGSRRIAFHPTCHLYIHEQMAYRELHGLSEVLLGEANRLFTLDDLVAAEPPISTLLIELPQREIGGQLPSWTELVRICEVARSRGMKLHMDGARLWDCGPYYERSYAEICSLFDSVYVSFYKILGSLPGAVLAGSSALIDDARIWQRRHGGNLQQQSSNVIAAKLAMDEQLPRIPEYVAKAREIAEVLRKFKRIRLVPDHPPTNMMHLYLHGDRERLIDAALQVASEQKAALFFDLAPDGKMELYVCDAALDFCADEIEMLFSRLFELAPD